MSRFLSICLFLFLLTGCASAPSHGPAVGAALTDVADVQARDANGRTALMHAARGGGVSRVEGLLERGAVVNTADNAGMTPLMLAVRNGHTAVAGLLLDHAAHSWSRDKKGMTPLMLAAAKGHGD